jgi:hypothetical protein
MFEIIDLMIRSVDLIRELFLNKTEAYFIKFFELSQSQNI